MISLRSQARAGFTLIELVVVLFILGLLMGVGVPFYLRYQRSAEDRTARANLNVLKQSVDVFRMELGQYPNRLEDLVERPKGDLGKRWTQPYLEKGILPQDPWNQGFIFKRTPGGTHEYELYSEGRPGEDNPVSVWEGELTREERSRRRE